ncbi:hypothetical protein GGI01_003147 [Coemansia sp. RSA 376]|nr:hypothetical protein GGI01_003147 [Coemansia sp. RSA 376]
MSTLSPLQSLPIHVAQMIADHVVDSSRLRLDNLEFEVDMLDVCQGAVLEELIRMNLLGVTYPVAHKLSVKVSSLSTKAHGVDKVTDPEYFEKVISLFVERLKDMVPMVKKFAPDQRPLIADSYLGNFVKQLFRLSDDVSYNVSGTTMSLEYQPTAIRHLVHMDAYGCDKSQLMMNLARLNAATMEFLTIGFWFLDDISPLFQNADGSYVQYPRLHTLMLASNPDITVPLRPVHPGAVPFPALRRLTMCSGYFGDDTPFRGNADTLELLDLHLSPEAFKVLKTHKIFTPVSHQQLRRVKLGQITRREQNLFRTDTEFVRFVTNIGPNAVERVINNSLRAPILQSIVPVLSDHTCIQTLDLPFTKLELWDVLALVKALPLLSNLKSEVPAIGKLPKGVSEETLPSYVRETYSPVGVQFRRWRLVASASVNMDQVVMCILLVAQACPNFDYAAVPHQNREVLMAHMKEMIEEDGFRQRAPRLRRLLFGGWNNEFPDVEAAHARSDEARMAAITTAMANYRV